MGQRTDGVLHVHLYVHILGYQGLLLCPLLHMLYLTECWVEIGPKIFDDFEIFWKIAEIRGRIFGRNPDKSLKSFPPYYSKSPLQLCLEISISSNSRNLLQFLQCVTVHCEGERRKIWKKITPTSLWFKKSIQRYQVWEILSSWIPLLESF